MTRRDLVALFDYLDARAAAPFAWGDAANDCVSHVVGAIEAQRGCPLPLPWGWANEREAVRVIGRAGGIARMADQLLSPIAPALASRGDIAGVPDARFGVALMIVEGATLVGPGEAGHDRLPRSAMTHAWSAMPPEDRRG